MRDADYTKPSQSEKKQGTGGISDIISAIDIIEASKMKKNSNNTSTTAAEDPSMTLLSLQSSTTSFPSTVAPLSLRDVEKSTVYSNAEILVDVYPPWTDIEAFKASVWSADRIKKGFAKRQRIIDQLCDVKLLQGSDALRKILNQVRIQYAYFILLFPYHLL